ncbi:hypothetical protein NL676_004280 [Syzygium grande]|nr:hypothetical protein NL676_004280 [Syzygium grande]
MGLPTVKLDGLSDRYPNEDSPSQNLTLIKSPSQKAVLCRVFSEDYEKVKNKTFDPRGQTVRGWNKIFLMACLFCLFVDPVFFFVPSVNNNYLCLHDGIDLKILLTIIRSIADVFYIIQIVVQFNTAFIAPSSRVFGRGELVIDHRKIALRYLRSRFWIDLYVALPLPQYIPRLYLILPLRLQISNAGGGLAKKAWEGAAFNLMLYLLASQVSGASWYLLSIGRQESCWRLACDQENSTCQYSFFECRYTQDPSRVTWKQQILQQVLLRYVVGSEQLEQYLQTANSQLETWRLKRTDTEQWMHHRHLPPELRQSIRMYDQYRWVSTRGVDEPSLLQDFPLDMHRNIKRHLCFDLVRRVPLFNQMDERMLDAICERLKPVLCTGNMYVVREGDPVQEMFFLFRGHLDSWTTNGGRVGFFNSSRLIPGDFCGEELLTWALDPRPSIVLPSSTRTVKAVKEVEAFSLAAADLKFVASQFRRLHSKELRHKFRFYSHQWRTWAACFIQSAWCRHKKLKEEAELRESEDGANGKLRPSKLFWDVYAKELIESTRRDENQQAGSTSDAVNTLQKPVDLDFAADY